MAACPFASSGARSTLTRQCHMWCRWHCQPAPAQGAPAQGGDPASTETSHRGRATEPRTSDRKPATAWEGRRRSSARRSSRSPPTSRSGVRERTICTSGSHRQQPRALSGAKGSSMWLLTMPLGDTMRAWYLAGNIHDFRRRAYMCLASNVRVPGQSEGDLVDRGSAGSSDEFICP